MGRFPMLPNCGKTTGMPPRIGSPAANWLFCAMNNISTPFARFHVHEVIPRLGGLLSGSKEYRYLQESIAAFPAAKVFAETMRECGWKVTRVQPLTFGVAHLFVAEKEA